jgi:hypothetical protein
VFSQAAVKHHHAQQGTKKAQGAISLFPLLHPFFLSARFPRPRPAIGPFASGKGEIPAVIPRLDELRMAHLPSLSQAIIVIRFATKRPVKLRPVRGVKGALNLT